MSNDKNLTSSGDIMAGEALTLKVNDQKELLAGQVRAFFGRMTPDSSPGWNTLTITGLPTGTRGITAWVTEWKSGDKPHAGGAWFNTESVQLFDEGRQCRVRFYSTWGSHLPAGAQVIYG